MTIDSVVPNPLDRIRLIGLVLVGGSHSPLNVSDTTINALEAVYQLPNEAILGSRPQHA